MNVTHAAAPGQPALAVRVAALARGWARTDVVEAYRRAAGCVYEDLPAADATRRGLLLDGQDLRTASLGAAS